MGTVGEDDPRSGAGSQLPDSVDHFSTAELADLRALVSALPPRERAAVVMCYWQDASEGEVARGLGVSARMVRYYLRRACTRLRAAYGTYGEEAGDARHGQ